VKLKLPVITVCPSTIMTLLWAMLRAESIITGCAYSKPKPGRIDDGVRRGLVSLRYGRSSASAENLERLYPMKDGSGPHCSTKRKPSAHRASALRRTR
jgi:hypothetical protein